MNKLLSCEFNIDTGDVELHYADGVMISIDCTGIENEAAMSLNARSELDWLVYMLLWTTQSWFSAVIWRGISGGCPVHTAGSRAIPDFTASGRGTGLTGAPPAFCLFCEIYFFRLPSL